jgi:hypothetical protein
MFILLLFIVVSYITTFRRKRQAGSVLLNLGWSKAQKMEIFLGCVFIIQNIISLLSEHPDETIGIVPSVIGGMLIIVGSNNFEIREGGIFYLDIAKKWEHVKSYDWEGKDSLSLTLNIRTSLPFFKIRSIPIPAQHKQTVENLLVQYVQGYKNST